MEILLKSQLIKQPGPKVIKKTSCSTQLSMNFFLLINVKMPSRKNSMLGLSERLRNAEFLDIFIFMSI